MRKDEIAHLFGACGPVSVRKLFGGIAIHVGRRIVGIDPDGGLLIKGDAETQAAYEGAGLTRWGYSHAKGGIQLLMPYWTLPPGAPEDHPQLEPLAGLAWQAALRSK